MATSKGRMLTPRERTMTISFSTMSCSSSLYSVSKSLRNWSRERILDLFEMLCGARITVSYMRPGGVFFDAPDDFWPALDQFLKDFES